MNFSKKSSKCNGNECGCPTKSPKKGKKLDTQLFPDCKGTKYDRDIVKKTRKKKKESSDSPTITKKARFGEEMFGLGGMTWENWKSYNYFKNGKTPSPEETYDFVEYCVGLFNKPIGEVISDDESAERLLKKIDFNGLRSMPNMNLPNRNKLIIDKAAACQAIMYDIESAGVPSGHEWGAEVVVSKAKFNLKKHIQAKKKLKEDINVSSNSNNSSSE